MAELNEFIAQAKADVQRLQTRRDAEASARRLLDGSAGEMTEEQFRELFRLLSTDFHNGKLAYGRFSPGFVGNHVNLLVANLGTLNEWTATLWQGSDEAMSDALRRLLADRKLLPGAGTSYPSMLMYLRNPDSWAVWGSSMDGGLRRVTDFSAHTPGSGRLEDYRAFSEAATALAAQHELAPELLDLVLWAANQPVEHPPSRSANAWTFQANPEYYDIDRALRELPEIEWTVRQNRRSVHVGDRAYIWRSGANAGIVAVGTVASEVEEREPDPSEIVYYLRREDFERVEPRVSIRVDRVLDEPLLRSALKEDAVLSGLGVIRFANATVHRVLPEEDELIRALLGETEQGDGKRSGHRVWWVNQGSTWEVERREGFLWAPTETRDGRKRHHWESMTEVRRGDRVIHYANGTIRAVSTVVSEYELAERHAELGESWESAGYLVAAEYRDLKPSVPLASIELATRLLSSSGPFNQHGGVKQGYLFPVDEEQAQQIAADVPALAALLDLDGSGVGDSQPPVTGGAAPPHFTFDWLVEQTNWEATRLKEIVDAIVGGSPQIVLAGPPGTSKTWVAKHLITYLTQDDPARCRIVQFHPTYGYEEFIEGLRPVVDHHGQIKFDRVDGLVLAYVKEMTHESEPSFVLIDEMNRANLARVFGELMYLFEYRDEPIDLRYTRGWELPANLKFVGTMNTADRSIRSIDIALRRRFDVFECQPDPSILERFYDSAGGLNEVENLVAGFQELNAQLEASLDKHHTVGHAFFMHERLTADRLRAVWARKIGPLLEEYFFDQDDLAASFSLARFWPGMSDAE